MIDDPFNLFVDTTDQQLGSNTNADCPLGHGGTYRLADGKQPLHLLGAGSLLQPIKDLSNLPQTTDHILVAIDLQQCPMVEMAQPAREVWEGDTGCTIDNACSQLAFQFRCKQCNLGEQRGITHSAQLVECRQEEDRQVSGAKFDFFEIGRQLHQPQHQCLSRLGAFLQTPLLQGLGNQLHLFGKHRGAKEFNHAQGAMDLVEYSGTVINLTRRIILHIPLKRSAGGLNSGVKLVLDPL